MLQSRSSAIRSRHEASLSESRAPSSLALAPLLLLAVVLAACQASASGAAGLARDLTPQAVVSPVPITALPTQESPAAPISPPTPLSGNSETAASATRTRYALTVDLDYARHHLDVSEVVTFPNQTADSLRGLELEVEPNRVPGVFHLQQLNWGDGRPVKDYSLQDGLLRIGLPSALLPGSSLTFAVSYSLDLPAKAGPLGYADGQANLTDWYPFLPAYEHGPGWLVHEPAAVGEHIAYDEADFQVDLRLVGSLQQLVIAAPAPAAIQGNRYQYRLEQARTFSLCIGDKLQSASRQAGWATVVSYYRPGDEAAANAALSATAQALTLYSRLFAPYPRRQLTLVEANFPDGLEEDGLYFLGPEYFSGYRGNPEGYLTAIAAHETAHQWWFARVGNDQAAEPWLDEALATYSELLFYENTYPGLVHWWWNWRVDRFAPAGPVDGRIYDYPAFRPYVNSVYLRGAQFLAHLRLKIGDPSFFDLLVDYATRMSGKRATAADFFAILRAHTRADLAPLEAGYFLHPH